MILKKCNFDQKKIIYYKKKQMSSFELVNHQLKHIFGGIEAQKNSSLQYLQTYQKKIVKSMQKAQVNQMKIYQALLTIKTSLRQLSENYLNLSKQNKSSGGLLLKLSNEINNFLQDFSQQSLSLSKKTASKVQNYVPNLKKIKEKYTECAQNLQHYRKKVVLLQKNVQKQPLANIKADEYERFQRNKQKLRKAQKEHDQILIKTTKRFVQFNSEGMKDVYNDLISMFANISSNIMQISSNFTKYLIENFTGHQNLLSKQTKVPKKESEEERKRKNQSTNNKSQSLEYHKNFFEHLIDQKQISSYLKKVVDKQMIKQQNQTIEQGFKSNKKINIPQQNEKKSGHFAQFKNVYNNHQLKNHHLLEKLKEQDPIQACDDLLQIQKPTIIPQSISQRIYNEPSPNKVLNERKQDQIKQNLMKFNKICQNNKVIKQKSPLAHIKPVQKTISPNFKANNTNVLKSSDQFFNLDYFEKHKKQQNVQQKLSHLHQNAFNFDLLSNNSQQAPSKQANKFTPNNSMNNFIFKQNSSIHTFDNFDLLITDKNEKSNNHHSNQTKKNESTNINLLNL